MEATYLLKYQDYYIFGAGETALNVFSVLQKNGKSVSGFIVSSGDERKIDGIPLLSLNPLSKIDYTLPIIIAVFNREPTAFLCDIINNLKSFGFSNVITFPEFHSVFPEELGDIFWLTDRIFYSENIEQYNDILKILYDKSSVNSFSSIIEYLRTFNPEKLFRPDFDNQYFPKDLSVWDGKDAFLDLGSYDGSNIVDACREKGVLDAAVAFEPDLENFQRIVNNPLLKSSAKEYFLYPCGVWSETTFLKFNIGSGESSAQNESGDQIVPVVKVDDILQIKPGYIKFDVEGAEIEALLGIKETIKKHRPSLAISIYHKPDHFYAIPKLVSSWDLGYKFYIRLHGNNLFDTVLYCIQ